MIPEADYDPTQHMSNRYNKTKFIPADPNEKCGCGHIVQNHTATKYQMKAMMADKSQYPLMRASCKFCKCKKVKL